MRPTVAAHLPLRPLHESWWGGAPPLTGAPPCTPAGLLCPPPGKGSGPPPLPGRVGATAHSGPHHPLPGSLGFRGCLQAVL